MFSAGKYFIGDPCYLVSDRELWREILVETDCFEGSSDGVFDFRGFKLAVSGTAYGDGCYPSSFGRKFSVDAGMLGAIPIEFFEKIVSPKTGHSSILSAMQFAAKMHDLLLLHEFKEDWKFHPCDDEGRIRFGREHYIETAPHLTWHGDLSKGE